MATEPNVLFTNFTNIFLEADKVQYEFLKLESQRVEKLYVRLFLIYQFNRKQRSISFQCRATLKLMILM